MSSKRGLKNLLSPPSSHHARDASRAVITNTTRCLADFSQGKARPEPKSWPASPACFKTEIDSDIATANPLVSGIRN